MVNVGDQAPAFSIPNQDGSDVSLADHSGKIRSDLVVSEGRYPWVNDRRQWVP